MNYETFIQECETLVNCKCDKKNGSCIRSKCQKDEIVCLRYSIAAILQFKVTQEEMGRMLGNRDHSTISHGLHKTNDTLQNKYLYPRLYDTFHEVKGIFKKYEIQETVND